MMEYIEYICTLEEILEEILEDILEYHLVI